MLVNHIKARLGVTHRQVELSDEAIIQCLQEETLKTLSVYHPFFCQTVLNLKDNEVMPMSNTYFLPERLGDDFDIVGVEVVIPVSTGAAANNMFYIPAGSDIQSIVSSLAATRLANTLSAATINPETYTFISPNMLRLYNNYSMSSVMLIVRTTHKRDFSTFPFGMLEMIKDLAFYDVAMDIYSIRKYFSNIQTLFAQINLDTEMLSSIPDKRTELIEKMRTRQLRFSNTRKLFIA
jgi:hypothetical protein